MQISEIYKSLQGESTYAGLPCVFVRLTGCNLRCTWCDSEFSFHGGRKMTIEEVFAEVARLTPVRAGTPARQLAEKLEFQIPGAEALLENKSAIAALKRCATQNQIFSANCESTSSENSGTKNPASYSCDPHNLVEITGGEPMLQEREAIPLMEKLLAAGYTILLETSGERPLARVPKKVVKIVDVKCPHSGEADTFDLSNLTALEPHDEIKFVLTDRTDYEFARDFVSEHQLARRVHAILFSPAFAKDSKGTRDVSHCLLDPEELAGWILADNVPARLSLQIHKLIWDPAAKGV